MQTLTIEFNDTQANISLAEDLFCSIDLTHDIDITEFVKKLTEFIEQNDTISLEKSNPNFSSDKQKLFYEMLQKVIQAFNETIQAENPNNEE